jgi:protein-S-isoprenylcysteine O-methyltransferase Ste14
VRYYLALALLVSMPAALVYWYLAHPLARHWRRLPAAVTYVALFGAMALVGYGVWRIREPLLAVDLGWSLWLVPPAVIVYSAAIGVERSCRKHLKVGTLVGVPELVEGARSPGLLREGIYSRVRHPRYLGVLLALLAFALFINYLATWLLLPVSVAGLYLVTVLEERELIERFGEEYREYRARVPRLLPGRVD